MPVDNSRVAISMEYMRAYFGNSSDILTLRGAMSLTASRPGKGYAKVHGDAGEAFKAKDVYLGKRGSLIFVFAPVADSITYSTMEMEEKQAIAVLFGFEKLLGDVRAGFVASSGPSQDLPDAYPDFGSW